MLGLPSVLPLHARPLHLRMDITVPCSAPPTPFKGGNVCCIDRLLGEGKASSRSDRSFGFCEFLPVRFHSNADGSVRLSAGDGGQENCTGTLLPLAHQWDAEDAECPSRFAPAPSAAVAADRRAAPALLLGACVLVVDESENNCARVLLTRRARHMRTFPGAWVPPGGGVDAGEQVADAARRELQEETGISLPDSVELTPLCAWESAFPTSVARCHEAGGLKRQHIVVYYVARISGALAASARRKLKWDTVTTEGIGTEVDCACWLPIPHTGAVGGGETAVCDALGLIDGVLVEALSGDGSTPSTVDAGVELRGIWPNEQGGGVTRGAFFALAMLARTQGGQKLVGTPSSKSPKL